MSHTTCTKGNAHMAVAADQITAGPLQWVGAELCQRVHLFLAGRCVCEVAVKFLPGSAEWDQAQRQRTLDGMGASCVANEGKNHG